MRIRGVDFTSAPSARKPITLAEATWDGHRLDVHEVQPLTSFRQLEAALAEPGPWRMGLDLPFSLPRCFIEEMGWPTDWRHLMAHLSVLKMDEFVATVRDWQAAQPAGGKEPLRRTDRRARSLSPLKLFYQPVGRMMVRGGPLLAASGVSVVPCAPNGDSRVAVEIYPTLLAREAGYPSYKKDGSIDPTTAAVLRKARQGILSHFAPRLALTDRLRKTTTDDASGDTLDAILGALATADSPPIPEDADPLEGWIFGARSGNESQEQERREQDQVHRRK